MKTIINKLRYTLLLGFIAIAALGNSLNAATLTVCNGTNTSQYIPFYGWYYDIAGTMVQMIYPASMLTDMDGGTITSVKFYSSTGLKFSGGTNTVTMGLTDNTTLSTITTLSGTTVSTTFNAVAGMTEIELTFNPGLTYTPGKNIIIETNLTTKGSCDPSSTNSTLFYGTTQSNNCSYCNKGGYAQKFLPKATFGYEPASTDPTITADPLTIDFEASPGGSDSKTVTVSGRNLTGNINVSGPSGGIFSVSPSSFTPSNGIVNNQLLTITYTPSEVGTHSAIVTLSSAGADPVYILLNGTCDLKKTICDGSATSSYLPIYGLYADEFQVNQMIYPAEMLEDLVGTELTSMTFYANAPIDAAIASGTWNIKLGTTDQDQFNSTLASNTRLAPTDVTDVVATTNYHLTTGSTELTIVFTTPFTYNGGNLLIDFQEIARTSDFKGTTFYGIEQALAGFNSHSSSATLPNNGIYTGTNSGVRNFLPKVTFTFESSEPITNGTVTPTTVDLSAQVGQSSTQTVTVRNTGNQPFTPVINTTNLPAEFTVTGGGTVAGGGTLPLTVTFTPTAEGTVSGSFTVTIPVPDDEDIVFTVTVTGSAYVISSTLTSNTVEVPVYKSEAKADGTFIFSQDEVEDDIDMSLSYNNGDVMVNVLVKDDEPITSYDLRHKEGSGSWTSAATATQDASNPKSYTYDNETFVIPSDAHEMWLPMTDEGVDATDIYFVPVTVANGIVTQGNTYGAPQVQPVTITLTPQYVNIGGSKSAGRPGGHWTMTIDGNEVDYCVYTPVVTVRPATPTNAVPYLVRAWLLENENVPFYSIKRVPNENDPSNTHIEADEELTYPKLLGQQELNAEMIGGDLHIGYDWNESQSPSPWGDVFPENIFAAPSDMSGENITIAARVYYYRLPESSNSRSLRADGDEAPEDGYGYGEGEGEGNGIPTAVSSIFTDRQVVDVKYVNTIGMQSDKPFDGVNIVVTRYSDGSITTTKVLK